MRGLESTPCWIAANRVLKYDDGCCTRRIIYLHDEEKSNRNEMYLPLKLKICCYGFQVFSCSQEKYDEQ